MKKKKIYQVYPKVKVRDQDQDDDDFDIVNGHERSDFESLSRHDSSSLGMDFQDDTPPTIVRIPVSYISNTVSEFKEAKRNEKDVDEDDRPNIRASPIPRPRAVLSSPDNDGVMGNKKSSKSDRPSALKNHSLIQNRHRNRHCEVLPVPSHIITESTNTRRNPKEVADRKSDFKGKQGSGIAVPSQKTSFRTRKPSSLHSNVL